MTDVALDERSTSKLQSWSPALYESHARFVSDLAQPVVDLLGIVPGDRVLDLGCGDGYLTDKLAALGAVVTGLDFSPELAAAAAARGLDVRVGNGEDLDTEAEFDAVFSNAAMHWMRRAQRVADGVYRALKPGGRFVAEFAGARNAKIIRSAVHDALEQRSISAADVDPWYLPEEDEYRGILENAGFDITMIRLFERPVIIDYPIAKWIETFGSPYLTVLRPELRADFLDEVTEVLRPHLQQADGRWLVDYTRLRFRAEKR